MYKDYTVKVKDYKQNITHTLTEYAQSQNEANAKALSFLRKALHHKDLELVDKQHRKRKPVTRTWTTNYMEVIKVPKFDKEAWLKRTKATRARIMEKYNK